MKISKLRFILLSLISIGLFAQFGCVENQNSETKTAEEPKDSVIKVEERTDNTMGIVETSTYFKATGTEPFWSLELAMDKIVFRTPEDSIITPHSTPNKAMDANVSRYIVNTESASLTIQINQSKCTNAMSGEEFPYEVSIEYKKSIDKEITKVMGCGYYVTDYRLHDIWSLESINNQKMTTEDFANEFPYIEINTTDNTFLGYAGCNRMNGKVFFETNLLRFNDIITTQMSCSNKNKEGEFLKALRNVTTYTIGNNQLKLSNPSGVELTFKKVD